MSRQRHRSLRGDRGAMLLQAIVLVFVMGSVIGALASYSVAGLRGSRSSTAVMRATAASRAGLDVAIEQYRSDAWAPCTALTPLPVTAQLELDADVLTLTCNPAGDRDGHPLVTVASQASAGSATVTFFAVLQVSVDGADIAVLTVDRR